MRVIAFSGKSGVGKSTIAKYIQEEYHAVKHSYASVLREEAEKAGFGREILWNKPTDPAVRRLLIGWGETRRLEYEDYLADKLWAKLENSLRLEDKIVVIDDLRYPNEVAQLHMFENVLGVPVLQVRVDCDFDPAPVLHESESALDDYQGFDIHFLNENNNWDKIKDLAVRLCGDELDGADGTNHTEVSLTEEQLQRREVDDFTRIMEKFSGEDPGVTDRGNSRCDSVGCCGSRACDCSCHLVYGHTGQDTGIH